MGMLTACPKYLCWLLPGFECGFFFVYSLGLVLFVCTALPRFLYVDRYLRLCIIIIIIKIIIENYNRNYTGLIVSLKYL